ncbi:hypothetical protein DTO271G3_1528 [Paecilomyces variotii]|nr:hypothetical protein DTO271G3_1528 [Paecilomyces variotii]
MGNNPSKTPSTGASSSSAAQNLSVPGNDRRVHRRVSNHGLKSAAADPSASKDSATGHPAANTQTPVQQRLQSRNIPDEAGRPERSDSKRIQRHRSVPKQDPSDPVQVPSRPSARRDPGVAPSGPPLNTYYGASAHLQRPPRLPLPIGDATATPGSPVIAPADPGIESVPWDALDEPLTRQTTSHRTTAVDEDEVVDDDQYSISGVGKAVPTTIEWRGPGEKVYVTGTFVNWEKKFRVHRSETDPGVLTTTLSLRPGTHHLKFIVDGDMRASDDLPTAVDFTNHLVNYIEVSADEVQRPRRESDRTNRSAIPPGVHPPQVLSEIIGTGPAGEAVEEEEEKEEPEEEIPPGDFRNIVPQFLADIDQEEDNDAYQQAANVISDSSAPPVLPLFLGKSILNGTTPMKDDNSVLNYPNHTVLNHLATSSIKNGVLATSVTTRYKRKYVTTILYKPTGDITGQ